jgi:hypothetical protein
MTIFEQFWPLRILLALAFVAFLGWYFYILLGKMLIERYIGDGDWRRGLLKFAAAVAVAWATLRLIHMFAFMLWEGLPVGNEYERLSSRYSDACLDTYQVDKNSYQTDVDWHAGAGVCEPLYRSLRRLYPRPSWLFGNAPQL